MKDLVGTSAPVITAGLILRNGGRFVFQAGYNATRDAIGIVRLGGHVEPGETPAECALREAAEEGCVRASIVLPPDTFVYEVDGESFDIARYDWPGEAPVPLLVATMTSSSAPGLSVTYLAESTGMPTPGGETQALVFLSSEEVHWLTSTTVSLAEFIDSGGRIVAASDLPADMALRPHGQLRTLSMLLSRKML